ncbi:MAG: glucose-1-phosphate thymidylyltransferase [Flavobacteriaceae bacterium]|nr:glucose-1-phosphate thymidylyltransferase [Flavobacteriaceae bacterium]
MKVVIPVAGIGSRMRPHTHTQPKSLIPVAGQPILAHIIRPLVEAGLNEFIFIIGYLGDKIESYITDTFPEIKAEFVMQTSGKGIGHAIWLAKDLLPDDKETIIVLGDTIFDTDLKKMLAMTGTQLGTKKVQDPRLFGVAELSDEGYVTKLIEKPTIPKSNLALVGIYKIGDTKALKEALEHNIYNKIKTQNEYHLTDALMRMVEQGTVMHTFDIDNWYDCGKPAILLETNAMLLRRLPQAKYDFPNTIIVPPVYVHPSAKVSNSIIGPDVSVGEGAVIDYSILKNSIIGPNALLNNAILHQSLIGNDASFQGPHQSLNIGDSTEINFGL